MIFKSNDSLQKKIDLLIETLEKNNLREIIYILGNKKEIIIRNILAGIFRGIGIGIRGEFNHSNIDIYTTQNSVTKYSNNRRVYSGYCRNCRK